MCYTFFHNSFEKHQTMPLIRQNNATQNASNYRTLHSHVYNNSCHFLLPFFPNAKRLSTLIRQQFPTSTTEKKNEITLRHAPFGNSARSPPPHASSGHLSILQIKSNDTVSSFHQRARANIPPYVSRELMSAH